VDQMERKCRVCGCTELRACNPPCSWIKEDLCSACVDIENKCHICGALGENTELTKCDDCGKLACAENEECVEILNNGDSHVCTKCISTYEKYDCNTCRNQYEDECPMQDYSYVYDCPEYNDTPILGYDTLAGFHELDNDEEYCDWPGCNHKFEEGDYITLEMDNGQEAIYCDDHHYNTPGSETSQIESKTRQEIIEEENKHE